MFYDSQNWLVIRINGASFTWWFSDQEAFLLRVWEGVWIDVTRLWNCLGGQLQGFDIHHKICHHWPFVIWKKCRACFDDISANGLPSPTLLKHLSENIKCPLDHSQSEYSGIITLQLQLHFDALPLLILRSFKQEIANNILSNSWTP